MRTTIILCLAMLLASTANVASAQTDSTDSFLFVTFELGDIRAKTPVQGVLTATYGDAIAETTISARGGETLQGSLSLPANATAGDWSVELNDLARQNVMRVVGTLTSEGIQILGSSVDAARLELPRDTTSLRVVKGYVSATVTLIGQLKNAGCCTATLGIDANADGNVSADETQSVAATTSEVRVSVTLPRAAPSVPYIFTIRSADDRVVARASGTYSFTKLNGVSAAGEFDPAFVEYVTGSVERQPHLVQHDIGSSILLQTVAGSERQEEGPRVFFTMGTPAAGAGSPSPQEGPATTASVEPSEVARPSLGQRILALLTGPVFLAIVLGSFLAAGLAFTARRMIERTR